MKRDTIPCPPPLPPSEALIHAAVDQGVTVDDLLDYQPADWQRLGEVAGCPDPLPWEYTEALVEFTIRTHDRLPLTRSYDV